MAYKLHRPKGEQRCDDNGDPFVGGVYTYYLTETLTPHSVFKDIDGTTWGPSVTLDAAGRLTDAIFVDEEAFKEIFTPPSGTGEAAITFDGYPGADPAVDVSSARPITPIGIGTDATIVMAEDDIGTVKDLNTTSTSISFVLMDPADLANGERITVRKTAAANTVNIIGPIDDATSLSLSNLFDSITLVSNGIDTYEVTGFARSGLLSGSITSDMLDSRIIAGLASVGDIKVVPFETVPTGWLECAGAAVSRTTYADLFAKIGITHGQGDGSTTFNLPDYRGLFWRVWDHGAGRDPNAASRTAMATGGVTGDHVGSKQAHAFQAHTHPVDLLVNLQSTGGGGGIVPSSSAAGSNTGAATGTTATETRPVNANVMAIILADPAAAAGAADFVHTMHNGAGAPSGGLGIDGDYYVDNTNTRFYGPKSAGSWSAYVSLIGPQGDKGDQGDVSAAQAITYALIFG